MKKLHISILILLTVLSTGCSLKTSISETNNDYVEKEASELQKDVEALISESSDIKEKIDNYNNAVEESINNINENQVIESEE